jgi:non-specific serine/threonine protein kinase
VVRVLDFVTATSLIAQTTLRSILGQSDLNHLLSERNKINQQLQLVIDGQTDAWGQTDARGPDGCLASRDDRHPAAPERRGILDDRARGSMSSPMDRSLDGSHSSEPGLSSAELRARRRALGLTQTQLAALLAVSTSTLASWERGEVRPDHPLHVRLALEQLEANRPTVVGRGGYADRPGSAVRSLTRSHATGAGQHRPSGHPQPGLGRLARARRDVLPAHLTSFVGRQQAIADLETCLAAARLVTLVGPGGVGKTRLALQLAAHLADSYRNGVWFVDLAPVTDPQLVGQAVATVLGVREQPDRSLVATLVAAIQAHRLLLVLDNCEHVVSACAALSDALLRAAPGLHILATGRQPLGIAGETVYRVPPLSLPEHTAPPMPEQLLQYDAVRLFVDRAAASVAGFALIEANALAVVDVCRQLDGIPLAIELAVTRLNLLTPEELARRLGDRFRLLTGGSRTAPTRQQTLRGALDWSHGLLTEDERVVFRRLSVFVGGWTLEAAEAVAAGEGVDALRLLDLLGQLVDKSLVLTTQHGAAVRFGMLETIRQYAWERLEAADEAASIRRMHQDWCVRLAEGSEPPGMHHSWHARPLLQEHDNLRAALLWSIERDDVEQGLRIAIALAHIWYMRGHASEGRERLGELLARANVRVAPAVRASALTSAGHLAYSQGDLPAAQRLLEESLAIWQALGEDSRRAVSLYLLGIAVYFRGDLEGALALFEDARAINHREGNRLREAMNLALMAQVRFEQSDLVRAAALNRQSLEIVQQRGPGWGTILALCMSGRLAAARGEHAEAHRRLEEGLELARELGIVQGVIWSLYYLGQHAFLQGDTPRGRFLYAQSLGLAREAGGRLAIAYCLEGLAGALAGAQPERALRLAGATKGLREALGSEPFPADGDRLDRWQRVAEHRLGKRAAAAAIAEGRARPLEDVMSDALASDAGAGSASRLRGGRAVGGLSAREVEVLRLVALAKTNREIAETLVLSQKTVEHHLSNIFAKLQVSSRAGATRVAMQAGLT